MINLSLAAFKKLWDISKLPKGWNYGDGAPPSAGAVKLAAITLHHLDSLGATKLDVLPNGADGITLMASYGDMFAEISVGGNAVFELVIEQDDTEIVEKPGLDFGGLVNALENAGWQSLKSSGSHTHVFSVESMGDSQARHFGYTAKVRRSYAPHAYCNPALRYAPTSTNITGASEANLPFSSGLAPKRLVMAQG